MMAGITRRWTKKSLVVLVVVLGVASYIFAAIWTQPLARGNDEQFTGIPGHNPANQTVDITGVSRDTLIWPYVDGGVTTLVTSLTNNGPVGLTVTGIETNGRWPAWGGLFTLTEARAAVLANPGQCCELEQPATWSARDQRPASAPGRHGSGGEPPSAGPHRRHSCAGSGRHRGPLPDGLRACIPRWSGGLVKRPPGTALDLDWDPLPCACDGGHHEGGVSGGGDSGHFGRQPRGLGGPPVLCVEPPGRPGALGMVVGNSVDRGGA